MRVQLRAESGRLLPLGVLCAAVGLFLALVPLHRDWFDLRVYYDAVHSWAEGPGGLYDYRVPGQTYGFTYPPFAAVCMWPMTLLSWPLVVAVGTTANLIAAVTVLRLLAGPVVRRHGFPPLPAYVVAGCLFALFEPVYDTVSFGQVNLFLLLLVLSDARQLARGGRAAGVGTGVACAIKLTPALFIGYLVITRRWRAASLATGVAAAATLLAHWLAPDTSHTFWATALWDTSRLGELAYVSNQSWQGALARLAYPGQPSSVWWACGALVVVVLWALKVRRAGADDVRLGVAATGVAACLVSPVSWVHHLVWLLPALVLLADRALEPPRRRLPLALVGAAYVLLSSSVVWLWRYDSGGIDGFIGGNAFVWVELGLLLALSVRPSDHLAAHERGQDQRPGQQRQPDRDQPETQHRGGRVGDRGPHADERQEERRLDGADPARRRHDPGDHRGRQIGEGDVQRGHRQLEGACHRDHDGGLQRGEADGPAPQGERPGGPGVQGAGVGQRRAQQVLDEGAQRTHAPQQRGSDGADRDQQEQGEDAPLGGQQAAERGRVR